MMKDKNYVFKKISVNYQQKKTKKYTQRHTIIKLMKTKNNAKSLESNQRKRKQYIQETAIQLTANFSSPIRKA